MKKIIIGIYFIILVCYGCAQTPVTKTDIAFKWVISSIEMKNNFIYSIENDSLKILPGLMSTISDTSMTSFASAMMKPSMEIFKKIFFHFKKDGTAELFDGQSDHSNNVTYVLDEEKSIVTTTEKVAGEADIVEQLRVRLVDGNLQVSFSQGEMDFVLILKKALL